MNRQQKEDLVKVLKDNFSDQESFLVGYRGLSVAKLQSLRKDIKSKGGNLKVAKVRLMKLAIQNVEGLDDLAPHMKNQLAVVFAGTGDTASVVKTLSDFQKDNDSFDLLAGFFDSRVVSKDDLKKIANLPSREVLLAKLCGTLNAPIVGLVCSLNQVVAQLPLVLKQIAEKKEK